jgi:DNA-binding NarL/FixJ family response regulator
VSEHSPDVHGIGDCEPAVKRTRDIPGPASEGLLFDALIPLTRREAEILDHLSEGRSNKEIARALGLGNNGVKFHVKNVFTKLGARRRTQAIRIAGEHGLVRVMKPTV